jgi:toxin ParE1/3/4
MKVVWTGRALSDLSALHAYIARENVRAANEIVVRIVARAEGQLPVLPEPGRPGRVAKTRELVLTGTPFVLPYRIVGDTIRILRVFHSARRWPKKL